MEFDLSGQTALVTGATSGLGRRFAMVLAGAGAKVALAGRRGGRLKDVRAEIERAGGAAAEIVLDVTQASAIAPAFDAIEAALGPVSILVNNAGVGTSGLVAEQPVDEFDAVINTNLRGPYMVAREAGRRMIGRKAGGRIINIGSIGTFRVLPGLTGYCVSKAAIGMLTQCLAREWARHEINVNAICPGYIETELNRDWFASEKGQTQIRSFLRRRLQDESELDGALLLLASAASKSITGALLTVDDGQSL
jgi:NAD(P)-dependent dehydrogenase (short-subunit alcohol dehydrogenase family)